MFSTTGRHSTSAFRGLLFFSHFLYTLQRLYEKVRRTLFNVKATTFYIGKTRFSERRVVLRSSFSILVQPFRVVLLLVTVRVCVSVFMCACIHAHVYTTCCKPFPTLIQPSAPRTNKNEGSGRRP